MLNKQFHDHYCFFFSTHFARNVQRGVRLVRDSAREAELNGWSARLLNGEPVEGLSFSGLMRECATQVHGDDMGAEMRGAGAVGVGRFWPSQRRASTVEGGDGDEDENEERVWKEDGEGSEEGDREGEGDA